MLGDGGGYGSLMSIKFNVRIKNTDTEQGQWSTVHRYRTTFLLFHLLLILSMLKKNKPKKPL